MTPEDADQFEFDSLTPADYVRVFQRIGFTGKQLEILRVHLAAPDQTITARQLARALGYSSFSAANLQYGKLAGKICSEMGVSPGTNLAVLVEFYKSPDSEYKLYLRPAVVKALKELGIGGKGRISVPKGDKAAREAVSIKRFIQAIEPLPADKPVDDPHKWYKTQKEHWLGWLGEYDGPGAYGRQIKKREAKFAYNHIVEPKMLLWLIKAAGVKAELVKAAECDCGKASSMPQGAAAVRRHVPWEEIAATLWPAGKKQKP